MRIFSVIIALGFISLISCRRDKEQESVANKPTPYNITIPKGFPTNLNIPTDNPMTVEGIELGRHLFYDGRLSGRNDTLMSCASCHHQKHAFTIGMEDSQYGKNGHPHGVTGINTPHYMLPLINLVFNNNGYLWNGKINANNPLDYYRNIEDLAWMAVYAPHEIHGDSARTKAMIQSIAMYPPMFKKAFGSDVVTMKNIGKAVAQFVRTLISANSKFDKYLNGETNLTNSELNGFQLFVTENGGDCFHCHGSEGNPLFTTNQYFNNSKDTCFSVECGNISDRYSYTLNPSDIGAFVAPTLRNIELTAPYMHDGRYTTLNEVINFYSFGLKWSPYVSPLMHHLKTNGVQLTYSQREDLKAFLLSLTDPDFITNPDFSNPRPTDPYFIKN